MSMKSRFLLKQLEIRSLSKNFVRSSYEHEKYVSIETTRNKVIKQKRLWILKN